MAIGNYDSGPGMVSCPPVGLYPVDDVSTDGGVTVHGDELETMLESGWEDEVVIESHQHHSFGHA